MELNMLQEEQPIPVTTFEQASDTLVLDQVPIRLDFQLGDDDLEVSLLIESLEQQYEDMILDSDDQEMLINLQSAKEWVSSHRNRLSGLFRYLKTLTNEA